VSPQSKGSVVYASYVSPFPTNSGERIRALNVISALKSLGYRVEAIVGDYDGADLEARSDAGVRFQRIPFAWPRLRQAASVYFRPHPDFIAQVSAIHKATPLAAIFLDYGFLGAQVGPLARLGPPVIIGTHNLESALTGQIPRTSLAGRLAIGLRQAIESAHERRFFRRADAVICVSEDDRAAYGRFIAPDRLHVVPNFVDIPDDYGGFARRDRIIMTGSFGNFQNVEGLRWFVEQVWDAELWARATLCVAGNLSDRAVLAFPDVPGVVGLGRRDDLLSEVAMSRCAIAPLWHGGGTRFKCIEAMAVRTPMVTTSKGCEGIAHDGAFRVADTPADFKAAILGLLDDNGEAARRAAAARAAFDRSYGLAANAARIGEVIAAATRISRMRSERASR
jgi:glycosyltransferase involved in cell wall biosynthesis